MTSKIEKYIQQLSLLPHPEGGFFMENFRSPGTIPASLMQDGLEGERNFSTSIYYLLGPGEYSKFHKIRQEEVWHYYDGSCALQIYILEKGDLRIEKLGRNQDEEENFQVVVPANCWFAAVPEDKEGFILTGCTVAPGFDFNDFEIGDSVDLLSKYPQHALVINKLT